MSHALSLGLLVGLLVIHLRPFDWAVGWYPRPGLQCL